MGSVRGWPERSGCSTQPDIATNAIGQVRQITPTKQSSKEEIKQMLASLRSMKLEKEAERKSVDEVSCLLPTCSFTRDAKLYRIDAEIEVLSQAIHYSETLTNGKVACERHRSAQQNLRELDAQLAELNNDMPIKILRSKEHQDLINKRDAMEKTVSILRWQCDAFKNATESFSANKSKLADVLTLHQAFSQQMSELGQIRGQLKQKALAVLPLAILLWLGILLGPAGIKAIAYWGVAPLASRRFGFTLAKDSSGQTDILAKSDRLQRIDLCAGEEVLIDPALHDSHSENLAVDSKLLLDGGAPFTSVAAGMFNLSRFRATSASNIVLKIKSSDSDKLCVVAIPEGSSLVLQPRFLAGIVQDSGRPIRITRHWRLSDLASWLTLQLRYMVFHGPAKLILKGCNGVEVDPVREETKLNQASTIGFTANLHYSVSRSEPFLPYLSGKQELFDDRFSGSVGYFVHEVSPRPSRATLLPGRGIEGIINSVLKIFGI